MIIEGTTLEHKITDKIHRKWLSKAKTAVIDKQELTVLPYGYLRTACEEAMQEYAKSYTLQVVREAYNDVVSNRKQTGIAPYDDGFVTGLSYLSTIIESKLTEES